MMALCVLFLLTMTPLFVLRFDFLYQIEKLSALEANDLVYNSFLYNVAVLVHYSNATFNFAIYVFSGSKFRAELRSVLCCKATQGTSLFGS